MTEPAADRRDRYAAALLGPDAAGSLDSAADELIDAVMAVADAELAAVPPPVDRAAYAQGIRAAIAELKRDALGVLPRLEAMAAEAQPATGADTETLAAMFEGLGLLLATSSRDWGQYAPDAWLYAVVLGWDCEETEHDETCVHGAMEEMQQRHGWSNEAVAKVRRYRAAVRALTEPAAGVRQGGVQSP